jgi:nitrite reductase (NADH) large subunit
MCTVDSEERAIALAGRFMQFYRENAKWRERTYDFVARIGLERIRAVIIEDCEGRGAALQGLGCSGTWRATRQG